MKNEYYAPLTEEEKLVLREKGSESEKYLN